MTGPQQLMGKLLHRCHTCDFIADFVAQLYRATKSPYATANVATATNPNMHRCKSNSLILGQT